jgi:hypothetical protein
LFQFTDFLSLRKTGLLDNYLKGVKGFWYAEFGAGLGLKTTAYKKLTHLNLIIYVQTD